MELSADMVLDSSALHLPAFASFDRVINGVAFQDAPLVTRNGYQYAVWYTYDGSPNEHVLIARRVLGSQTWQHFDTGRNLINGDNSWDGHNVVSLGISGDGRLHLAYDMHGNDLKYFNSIPGVALNPESTPWNSSIFNADRNWLVAPGQVLTRVTYPEFSLAPDGNLAMTYRFAASGSGDVILSTYDASAGTWNTPHQIINRTGSYTDRLGTSSNRNGYLNALDFGPDGTIHITWTWRESSTGGNHDILYAYSEDRGNTWKNNAGTVVGTVASPIRVNSPGIVIAAMDRTNGLGNQQGQVVDREGRVHVLVRHRRDEPGYEWQPSDGTDYHTEDAAHYHYFRDPDSRIWTRVQLPVTRRVVSRPSIGYDRHGNVYGVYISPRDQSTQIDSTEGDLIIARATKAANYADWTIVFTDHRDFISEPFIDQDRLVDDDVLSIFAQEWSTVPSRPSGTPLHVLEFDVRAYDYGDAPDPGFPTLRASNGARHLPGNLYFGARIDAEFDGQPHSGATGDDLALSDDEDGVDFPPLFAGESATVNLFVTGGPALADVWVDFNSDGDWNDSGERIANGTSVVSGDNALSFTVPGNAVAGNSFARARLSTAGVNGPTGYAADGEVEDEQVSVGQTTVSIADVERNEGDDGTTSFDFPVRLNRAIDDNVFVSYATATGTANAADFEAVNGTLEIPAGETTAVISVLVNGDTVFEPDESFTVDLSDAVGVSIGIDQGTGTVRNDDESTGAVQFDSASYSVSESDATATLRVTRTGGSSGAASVQIATADGSAAEGSDYSSVTRTLNWDDGEGGGKTVTVSINDDDANESGETVLLTLSDATGATLGSPATAVLSIVDNDAVGVVQFGAASFQVGESDSPATITVTRTGGSAGAASVRIATTDGSAESGGDYSAMTRTVEWGNGEAGSKAVSIPIQSDTADEPDETVLLTLSEATGAVLGTPATATLTITDDDTPAAGVMQFSAANYSVGESGATATLTLMRTAGSFGAASVRIATSNGSAIAGSDYGAVTQTVTWTSGDDSSKSVSISIQSDTTDEPDETVLLTLSNATGAALGTPATAILTIVDDDDPSAGLVQFSAANYSIGESGTTATLTLTRTAGSFGAASVRIATSNGSAIAGSDYGAVTQTVIWTNGDDSAKAVSIPLQSDTTDEPDETVLLTLSNATGAALGTPATAILTITDDNDPGAGVVQFGAATYSVAESVGNATLTLTRSGGSFGAASVRVATSNGSAVAGSDYGAVTQTVNWASGDVSAKSVTIPIQSDTTDEPDETVLLALSNASGAGLGTPSTAVLTIRGSSSNPTVSFATASARALESAGAILIRVNLSQVSTRNITVPVTFGGTARRPADFTRSTNSLSIPAGSSGADLRVTIINDTVSEPTETVILTMGTPVNATKGPIVTHTLSIDDNDLRDPTPTPTVRFSSSGSTVSESAGVVTVRVNLSEASDQTVTVPLSFGGTAARPSDYSVPSTTLSIPAGATGADLRMTVVNDNRQEPAETAVVTIGTPTNAVRGSPEAYTLTISRSD
ncbi:MAG: Calx-beta domain-containing protein [Panacagrimonas sp.]